MLKKLSLRWRLTLLSLLLLTICCIGLTITVNISALKMAQVIEAVPITLAAIGEEKNAVPSVPAAELNPSKAIGTVEAKQSFVLESFIYMAAIILFGGGLTYYVCGKALIPLQELGGQIKNRTVQNLSAMLQVPPTNDEVADLTRSFNEMSQKLNAAFNMQSRFSQSAAHELRTPLAVLRTKIDVFNKKQDRTKEEYSALITTISTQTDRLTALVGELLSLANTDALENSGKIDPNKMLASVAKELSIPAKEKQINIEINGEAKEIIGSESLLRRAFYNLIENAIRYSEPNTKVIITLKNDDERAVISVADSGIGINPEHHELIFEPFYRVDKSRSRQLGGAGLGLCIVKNIIEQHSGIIMVSENENKGSVFTVVL